MAHIKVQIPLAEHETTQHDTTKQTKYFFYFSSQG